MNYQFNILEVLSDDELKRIAKDVIENQEWFSHDEYALVVHYSIKNDVLNNVDKYLKDIVNERLTYLFNFAYDLHHEYGADFKMCQKAYTKWDELKLASDDYQEAFFKTLKEQFIALKKLGLRFN